jgi:RimJ/RimL family protein N-acetyltransferase
LKIIERFGFVKEGLLREWYANAGTFEDVYAFAILRKEYEQVKMT